MIDDGETSSRPHGDTIKLETETGTDGIARPVIHILLSDGRVSAFRNKAIAITEPIGGEQPANDGRVYALLIDSNGTPYQTPEGGYAVVEAPLVQLGMVTEEIDQSLTWKDVARRAGVSLSSVKRAADAGQIPKPQSVPGMDRAVRFMSSDVAAWIKGDREKHKAKGRA